MRVGGIESELWDEAPVLQDLPVTMPFGLRVGDLLFLTFIFLGLNRVLSLMTNYGFAIAFLAPLATTLVLYLLLVWMRQGHPDGYHWSLLHWLEVWKLPGAYPAKERHYDAF